MSSTSTVVFDPKEKSPKEEDHLICSTKKIKSKESMGEEEMEITEEVSPLPNLPSQSQTSSPKMLDTPAEGPIIESFKDALATPRSKDFYFNELEDNINTEEEDEDGDTDIQDGPTPQRDDGIPTIDLPKKLLKEIRQPWANALLIRLLGKSIGYGMLCSRVKTLWGLQDDFNAIDLGNNYFLFKFSSQEDCAMVYSGGPWVITISRYANGSLTSRHRKPLKPPQLSGLGFRSFRLSAFKKKFYTPSRGN
ncbi:hypothetical protein ACSBR1_042044 [Camellia fascicularis]